MSEIIELLEKYKVNANPQTRRVFDVLNDIERGKITIPDYQRNFVWDNKTQSRFIESIFLNIPIPPIFISNKVIDNGATKVSEVIDGSQRLRTLYKFHKSKLRLKFLEKVDNLNGLTSKDIEKGIYSNYFEDRDIPIIVIDSNTNHDLQYEIFERLNQGSVSLLPQELRNCIYHGEFNDFLLELRHNEVYKFLMKDFANFKYVENPINFNEETPHAFKKDRVRLNDVEMILRFFALYEVHIKLNNGDYRTPKKEFLNYYMNEKVNGSADSHYNFSSEELKTQFFRAINIVEKVFGNHFRRYYLKNNSLVWITTLNKAIFDVQMLGLLKYDDEFIEVNKELIYQEYLNLCIFDDRFNRTINANTDQQINDRMNIWLDRIDDIYGNPNKYINKNNCLKESIIAENCSICNQRISNLDEATINDYGKVNHKICQKGIYEVEDDKKAAYYEQKIINAIERGGNLPALIHDFINERKSASFQEIINHILKHNYKQGNQVNQVLGVLNKFFPVVKYGNGQNAEYEWVDDD